MTARTKQYHGIEIAVDGQKFDSCLFKDCILNYRGGAIPNFLNCAFDGSKFIFAGSAGNTLLLLRAFLADPGMHSFADKSLNTDDGPSQLDINCFFVQERATVEFVGGGVKVCWGRGRTRETGTYSEVRDAIKAAMASRNSYFQESI